MKSVPPVPPAQQMRVPLIGGVNQAQMLRAFEDAHRDLLQRALANGIPPVVVANIVVLNGHSLLIQGSVYNILEQEGGLRKVVENVEAAREEADQAAAAAAAFAPPTPTGDPGAPSDPAPGPKLVVP